VKDDALSGRRRWRPEAVDQKTNTPRPFRGRGVQGAEGSIWNGKFVPRGHIHAA
jgi:hypothetical protein